MSASYHTADRMKWEIWPRRKRLKFMRRYHREHGRRFRWFKAVYRHAIKPVQPGEKVILFIRGTDKTVEMTVV